MKKVLVFLFFAFFSFPILADSQRNTWGFEYSEINNEETACLNRLFDGFDNNPIIDDSRLRKLLPTRRPSAKPTRWVSDNNNEYFDKLEKYNTEMGATYDTVNDTWAYNGVHYDTGSKLNKAIEVADAIQEHEFTTFYKSDGHAVIYNTTRNRWEYGNVVTYNNLDNTWTYDGDTYTSVIDLDEEVFKLYKDASAYNLYDFYNKKWHGIHCRQQDALKEFYAALSSTGGSTVREPDPLYWPIDDPNRGIFTYAGIDEVTGSSGSIYIRSIDLSDYNLEGRIPKRMFLPGIFYGTSNYPVIHNTSSFDIRNNPGLCIDASIRQTFNAFKAVVTVSFSESDGGDVTDVIPDCETSSTPVTPVTPPVTPVTPPVTPVTPPVTPVTPPVTPVTPPVNPVTPPVNPVTPPVNPVTPPVTPPTGGTTPDRPMYLRATAGNSHVALSWTAPLNTGGVDLTGYSYRLKLSNEGFFGAWTEIPGGSGVHAYTVTGLTNGSEYILEVRANNFHGGSLPARVQITLPVVTNIENEELPGGVMLAGNYPNPFNPTTLITYRLTRPVHVYLAVYDIRGQEIAILADGIRPAGEHRVLFDAQGLSTGHYMYTIHADGQTKTRTMTLVK